MRTLRDVVDRYAVAVAGLCFMLVLLLLALEALLS